LQYAGSPFFDKTHRYELDFCRKHGAFASLNSKRHFSRILRHRPTKAANFVPYRREISGAKIITYRKSPISAHYPKKHIVTEAVNG